MGLYLTMEIMRSFVSVLMVFFGERPGEPSHIMTMLRHDSAEKIAIWSHGNNGNMGAFHQKYPIFIAI